MIAFKVLPNSLGICDWQYAKHTHDCRKAEHHKGRYKTHKINASVIRRKSRTIRKVVLLNPPNLHSVFKMVMGEKKAFCRKEGLKRIDI